MSAMRTITIERGYDPREFTLVPFGGMGPTIAGRFAPDLGISRILIPQRPGRLQRLWHAGHRRASDAQRHAHHAAGRRSSASDLDAIFREMEDGGDWPISLRENFPRERLTDAAIGRHALSRTVLRGERAGRALAGRRRHRRAGASASMSAPSPLRPHGAGRGGRDRQFRGDRRRHHSQAIAQDVPGRAGRAARRRTKRVRPFSVRRKRCPCRSSGATRWRPARSSTARR